MKSIKAKLGGRKEEFEGNSNTLMAGGKCSSLLYMNSRRTRPYYFRRCKRAGPRPTEIDSLPDELISCILLRLPAHHLHDIARFVCRRWSLTINSENFVTTQIQHSTYGLLLSCFAGEGARHPILITATQGRIVVTKLSHICRRVLLTSANGLAAEIDWSIKTYEATVSITNPATKQSLLLPSLARADYPSFAIGFAMISSKYKLTVPHDDSEGTSLAILTLGVDKAWRNVENVPQNFGGLLRQRPLSTEGFMHWVRPGWSYFLTMDVETEIFRVMTSPYRFDDGLMHWQPLYHLSTGKFLSLLIACGDFLWEIWGMKSETGEWRKVLPDIKLGGAKMWLQKFASAGKDGGDQVLEPFGWVKYPEVLAFRFSGESRTCIFYNLDTYQISSAELPYSCRSFYAFAHKNSLCHVFEF